jgi:hypothetical protein
MGLISGIIDRMANKAEAEASTLLARYREMQDSSAEAQSIKLKHRTDDNGTQLAERAFNAHKQLFQELLQSSPGISLVRSKQRVQIIEQFCLAMWVKIVGRDNYQAMVEKLKGDHASTGR